MNEQIYSDSIYILKARTWSIRQWGQCRISVFSFFLLEGIQALCNQDTLSLSQMDELSARCDYTWRDPPRNEPALSILTYQEIIKIF